MRAKKTPEQLERERLERRWVPAILESIDSMTPGGYRPSRSWKSNLASFVGKLWVTLIILLLVVLAVAQSAKSRTPDAPVTVELHRL